MITEKTIIDAIKATAMMCGADVQDDAAKMMMFELKPYGGERVMEMLQKLRRTHKGRFSLSQMIEIIESQDGRPDADEAWAIAIEALDEYKSIVWNDEIMAAYSVCSPILESGDKVAARMAFKSAYTRMVTEARENGFRPNWTPSLGYDKEGREIALAEAVRLGRIETERAEALLPPPCSPDSLAFQLSNGVGVRLLNVDGKDAESHYLDVSKPLTEEQKRRNLEKLEEIKSKFHIKPVVGADYVPEDESQ